MRRPTGVAGRSCGARDIPSCCPLSACPYTFQSAAYSVQSPSQPNRFIAPPLVKSRSFKEPFSQVSSPSRPRVSIAQRSVEPEGCLARGAQRGAGAVHTALQARNLSRQAGRLGLRQGGSAGGGAELDAQLVLASLQGLNGADGGVGGLVCVCERGQGGWRRRGARHRGARWQQSWGGSGGMGGGGQKIDRQGTADPCYHPIHPSQAKALTHPTPNQASAPPCPPATPVPTARRGWQQRMPARRPRRG